MDCQSPPVRGQSHCVLTPVAVCSSLRGSAVHCQPCLRLVMLVGPPGLNILTGVSSTLVLLCRPPAAVRESAVHCSWKSSLTTDERRRQGAELRTGSRGAISTVPFMASKPCQHLLHGSHLPVLGPLVILCTEPAAA